MKVAEKKDHYASAPSWYLQPPLQGEKDWFESIVPLSRWVDVEVANLQEELANLKLERPLVLHLCGQRGAGKSAFAKALLSCAKGREAFEVEVGSGQSSVTTSFRKYELFPGIFLGDAWGWDGSTQAKNYSRGEYEMMLEGSLVEDAPEGGVDKKAHKAQNKNKYEPVGCVIFFVPQDDITEAYVEQLSKFQKTTESNGIPHIFVVSKFDTVPVIGDVCEKADFWSHNAVTAKREKLARMLGVSPLDVFPCMSALKFSIGAKEQAFVNLTVLRILHRALIKVQDMRKLSKQ